MATLKKNLFEKTSYATNEIKIIDDSISSKPFWIKPSDIIGKSITIRYETFLSSFGSWEGETMAHLICLFFTENDDLWYPVKVSDLNAFIKKHRTDEFFDVKGFGSRSDYGCIVGNKIIFTNRFIERCAGFRAKDELEAWKVQNVFELNAKN